jgi:hypothetical protein
VSRPSASPNLQAIEKLHETPRNTNVMDITVEGNDLVAILGDKSGPKQGGIRQTRVVGTVLAG